VERGGELSNALALILSLYGSTTSLTSISLSFQAFCGRMYDGASKNIRSGTSPLVSADTAFWPSAMNGMTLRSILLPLAFW
jgi:hypothetical protein